MSLQGPPGWLGGTRGQELTFRTRSWKVQLTTLSPISDPLYLPVYPEMTGIEEIYMEMWSHDAQRKKT